MYLTKWPVAVCSSDFSSCFTAALFTLKNTGSWAHSQAQTPERFFLHIPETVTFSDTFMAMCLNFQCFVTEVYLINLQKVKHILQHRSLSFSAE